jgi:polyisoprenoid-binding protein YceI
MRTDPATTTATDLPLAAGTWPLDAMHSGVHFKVRHIGLSNVRGRFNRFDATLSVGETLADTRVEATTDMSSVDTNQPDRDAHLLRGRADRR